MTPPMHDYEILERALHLRLAREYGITAACEKCILHELRTLHPEIAPGEIYTYTDSLGREHTWPKHRLDLVARHYPISTVPYKRMLALLEESGIDEAHLEHLSEAALKIPAIIVEVEIVPGRFRNIVADGNHRATMLARAERPVPVKWIRVRDEPKCRVTDEDLARHMAVAQANGFLVWELPATYAATVDEAGVARFGRIAAPAGGSTNVYFQKASNAEELALPAGLIPPGARGLVEFDLDTRPLWADIARSAIFAPTMRFKGGPVFVTPVPLGALPPDIQRVEVR